MISLSLRIFSDGVLDSNKVYKSVSIVDYIVSPWCVAALGMLLARDCLLAALID
jgi:hypothetical protein